MPLPTRRRDEKRGEFLNRCMANEEMNKEFPDSGQRFAAIVTGKPLRLS